MLLGGALCLLGGCDEEKPETPFQVATALPHEKGPEAFPSAEEPPGKRAATMQRAPENANTWKVFDRTLRAPAGTELRAALPIPANESDDILVLVTPASTDGRPQDAGLFQADAAGELTARIAPHPELLPSGKDCRLDPTLSAAGQHSVVVELRARCSTRLLPGTPTRSLSLVTPSAESPVLVALQSSDSAPGEELELTLTGRDEDGDGSDDVQLEVSMRSPSGARESLPLAWLSRTAGASRLPDEPVKALSKRASRLSISAVRKAEREGVLAQVRTLRRLLAAICAELATPRLHRENGSAIKCGDLNPALARLTHAAVQAEVGQGRLGSALGLAERADWFGKKPSDKEQKALAQVLLSKIDARPAQQRARFDVQAASQATAHASPLRFDEWGLWLEDPSGKVKRLTMKGDPPLVQPATDDAPGRVVEAPSWPLELPGPGGKRLSAALPSCQRSEVQLSFSRPSGKPLTPIPIGMLAPRPGNCRTYTGFALVAEPVSWNAGQLTLILGGELVGSGGQVRAPEHPVAWGTNFGLAVQHGSRLTLWTGISTAGLHHCVASQAAERVACVKGSSVYVYSPTGDDAPKAGGRAE